VKDTERDTHTWILWIRVTIGFLSLPGLDTI